LTQSSRKPAEQYSSRGSTRLDHRFSLLDGASEPNNAFMVARLNTVRWDLTAATDFVRG